MSLNESLHLEAASEPPLGPVPRHAPEVLDNSEARSVLAQEHHEQHVAQLWLEASEERGPYFRKGAAHG